MFLQNATHYTEVITYGIDPMIELMRILEEDIGQDLVPGSREAILWTEIRGKALQVRESIERVCSTRQRLNRHKP